MVFLPQNEALLQVKPVQEQRWDLPFSVGALLQPANNERTPVNPIDVANQQQALQAKNTLENTQAVGAAQETNQKQRGFQLSMLNGVLALPPEQQEAALGNAVRMMNRLGGTQYPEDMSLAQGKMLAMANMQTQALPEFQINSAKAQFYQGLANTANPQPAGQQPTAQLSGTPMPANGINSGVAPIPANGINSGVAPIPAGGGSPINGANFSLTPAQQTALAVFDPAGSNALNNLPQGKQAIAKAEAEGKNQGEALKAVAGMDSRIQNAINILDDQIELAPKTATGSIIGAATVGLESNIAGLPGAKYLGLDNPQLPVYQNKFEQNNANLFLQELPAIIQASGGRVDIPLIKAIQQASAINEYGTPKEKIEAAQNLKGLLVKLQQNIHNNASALGAGNIPIQPIKDTNPPNSKNTSGTAGTPMPPEGARKASDGNFYLPDPQLPGKYLKWLP